MAASPIGNVSFSAQTARIYQAHARESDLEKAKEVVKNNIEASVDKIATNILSGCKAFDRISLSKLENVKEAIKNELIDKICDLAKNHLSSGSCDKFDIELTDGLKKEVLDQAIISNKSIYKSKAGKVYLKTLKDEYKELSNEILRYRSMDKLTLLSNEKEVGNLKLKFEQFDSIYQKLLSAGNLDSKDIKLTDSIREFRIEFLKYKKNSIIEDS